MESSMKKYALLELENDINKNLDSKGFWSKPLILIDYQSGEELCRFLSKFTNSIFFISNFISEININDVMNIIFEYKFDNINFDYSHGILYVCTLKNSLSLDRAVVKKFYGKLDILGGSCFVLSISKINDGVEFLFHIDIYPDQENIEFS